ncbi:MAG: Mur ligase family protein [Methanobacteriaceae archaeon]|nr:Mur ligase family protein [Methanobacteriaceae archaeon]
MNDLKNAVFGVVGICGINGNLISRVLVDHGFTVIGTDLSSKEECKFQSALDSYDMKIYYGQPPEEFYEEVDYMILPMALSEKSEPYKKTIEHNIPLLTPDDILDKINPAKQVICVGGTNGKTTTTAMIKHICYEYGIKPCEHNLKNMQGNIRYIPGLQARLNGDLAILETGTQGIPGDLTRTMKDCQPNAVVLTNITPDHLSDGSSFLDYARVKGGLVNAVQNKRIIVNGDDPTVMGLLKELEYTGDLMTFGLEYETFEEVKKECFCGKQIKINEIIAGCGTYECDCGLTYKTPEFLAKNITGNNRNKFTFNCPTGDYDFELQVSGLHNIYNAMGAIIAAHEILDIPFSDIKRALSTFTGVSGRMEKVGVVNGKDLMIDYAHNPAGILTVLSEIKKQYGSVCIVITTISESGESGDYQILKAASTFADHIIPASHASHVCALKLIDDPKFKNKIRLPEVEPEEFKKGTLGATGDQLLEGVKSAFNTNDNIVVCTGDASFKYKDKLYELVN